MPGRNKKNTDRGDCTVSDKKRVGVLTFHDYDNYGAGLQSYALQKKLLEAGYDAELINYSCPYIHHRFTLSSLKKKGFVDYAYGVIGHICYMPRRKGFSRFRRQLRISPQVISCEELSALSAGYDVVVAGSDQLWDCSLTDYDRTYFLNFTAEGTRRISYAVSMGEHYPDESFRQTMAQDLAAFDTILMREGYGADFVCTLTGKRPKVACDPTLLLTGEEWSRLAGEENPEKEGYILVYQLGVSPSLVRQAVELSKRTGLALHFIPFPLVGLARAHIHPAADPCKWLRLIRDAEYVISDSFHGIVFSLLFERNFYAKVDGQHVNRRLMELLEQVGMTDRILSDQMLPPDAAASMDFTGCQEILDGIREKSLRLLNGALEG